MNATTSRLPDSFAYTSRPEWWNHDDFTGNWPPVYCGAGLLAGHHSRRCAVSEVALQGGVARSRTNCCSRKGANHFWLRRGCLAPPSPHPRQTCNDGADHRAKPIQKTHCGWRNVWRHSGEGWRPSAQKFFPPAFGCGFAAQTAIHAFVRNVNSSGISSLTVETVQETSGAH